MAAVVPLGQRPPADDSCIINVIIKTDKNGSKLTSDIFKNKIY